MPAKRRRARRVKRRRPGRKRGYASSMRRWRVYKKLRRVYSSKRRGTRVYGKRVYWPSGTYSLFGTAGQYAHTTSSVAGSFTSQIITIPIGGMDFFGELSQLYRWYKVLSLTITLTPTLTRDVLGIGNTQGQIIMVPHYDPTEAFTFAASRNSFVQFMALKGAKSFKWPTNGKSFSLTIYPKILMAKYYGFSGLQYSYKPIRSWWTFNDNISNQPLHFGYGIYSYWPTDSTNHTRLFDITWHMRFRCAGRNVNNF